MPAEFFYLDGHQESGTVELDVHGQPPYVVERDGKRFGLDRVGSAGLALYTERRSSRGMPRRTPGGG